MKKRILALSLALAALGTACGTLFAGCASDDNTSIAESTDLTYNPKEESSLNSSSQLQEDEPDIDIPAGLFPGTADEDMITVNIQQEPPRMNTLLSADTVSFSLMKNIYENLVRLDRNDNVSPGAAESWDISSDKRKYTFHLRKDMVWTNGDLVTAHDFEFAWKELLNPETGAQYAYFLYGVEGAREYNEGSGSREDVKITALDDSTFEVVLLQPTEYFLGQTACGPLSPINQKFYEAVGAELYGTQAEYILSNGPFTMTSWEHDSEIRLEKNPDYFGAEDIKLPKIKCLMITDSSAAANLFMSNKLDMTMLTFGSQSRQIEDAGQEVLSYDDGSSFFIKMNQENEVLSNLNIRMAIAAVIDRNAFVSEVLQNSSVPSVSIVPQIIKGQNGAFSEEVTSPWELSGNPEAAKAFFEQGLEELGMTAQEAGSKITLIAGGGDSGTAMAAFFKEEFSSKLGLDIEIENIPLKNKIERVAAMDYALALEGWDAGYDAPNAFLDLFVTGGGNNCTGFSNEEYDRLAADAAAETDPEKRMGIFYRIDEIIAENAVAAPLYYRVKDYAVSDKVKGIYRTAFQDLMFTEAYIAGYSVF